MTAEVSHDPSGWLKARASANVGHNDTTADVCHESMFWLNLAAPWNMLPRTFTLEVCHELRGWLNWPQFLNMPPNDVCELGFQPSMLMLKTFASWNTLSNPDPCDFALPPPMLLTCQEPMSPLNAPVL